MANSYDLLKIYGIPPASYSEENPDDLFLSNLPSLEQIASFNLALQQNSYPQGTSSGMNNQQLPVSVDNYPSDTSTPATVIGQMPAEIMGINTQGSASSELPPSLSPTTGMQSQQGSLTQQITDFSNPYPVTAESIQYLNGFIRTQIGRRAQIQFLIGNSEMTTKDGFLLGVGANYILINEIGTNDITACDFYNIKFIRFLY